MGNERNQYVLFEPKERNCHWAESSSGMDKAEIAPWSLSCELTVAADGKTVKFIEWGYLFPQTEWNADSFRL